MASSWSEDITVKFVWENVKHECLWNVKHLEYKNKHARSAAVLAMKTEINISNFNEKEILLKIKSLRSTYSQELRKIKESNKSGAGLDDIYTPNIKWFSILDSAVKSVNLNTRNTEDNVGYNKVEDTQSQSDSNTSQEDEPSTSKELNTPSNVGQCKRRLNELHKLVDKVNSVTDIVNSKDIENHEFDLFGKSVAAQLKAMPFPLALEAQQYVQNYLSQLRIQQIKNSSANYTISHQKTATPSRFTSSLVYSEILSPGTSRSTLTSLPNEMAYSLNPSTQYIDTPTQSFPSSSFVQSQQFSRAQDSVTTVSSVQSSSNILSQAISSTTDDEESVFLYFVKY